MKTGVNTLLWAGMFTDKEIPLIQKSKKAGFEVCEIPLFDPDAVTTARVRAAADKAGVEMALCCVVPTNANPIAQQKAVRTKATTRLKRLINACNALGGHIICGPTYSPVGHLVGRGRTRQEWKWCVACYKEIMPLAEDLGVTVAVEPINRFENYFINVIDDVLELIEDVGSPNLRAQLDTFHMNIEEKDSPAAIMRAGKKLAHFHVSESDRGVPGTGQVDWAGCFKALKAINYDGCLAVESFNAALKEIAAATCIWRKIAPSQDAIAKGALNVIKKYW
ncbi:MAG: sugar phosphate isomerase/epimerase family protein [Planctomycetota bacterium]